MREMSDVYRTRYSMLCDGYQSGRLGCYPSGSKIDEVTEWKTHARNAENMISARNSCFRANGMMLISGGKINAKKSENTPRK